MEDLEQYMTPEYLSLPSVIPKSAVMRHGDGYGWGAEMPPDVQLQYFYPVHDPVTHVLLTYTDTDPCATEEECTRAVQDMQARDMKTLPDIMYNFVIGGDGRSYIGRGWALTPELPEHHKDKKGKIYTFAVLGRKGTELSSSARELFNEIMECGKVNTFITKDATVYEEL